MTNQERDVQRKIKVLHYAEQSGCVAKTCRYFGIGRASFYRWRSAFQSRGKAGFVNAKPIPKNPANQIPLEIVDKVLHLRRTYHPGPIRIVWYLARYHDVKISEAGRQPNPQAQRREPIAARHAYPKSSQKTLQQTGSWPSHSDGRQIPNLCGPHGEKIRRFQRGRIIAQNFYHDIHTSTELGIHFTNPCARCAWKSNFLVPRHAQKRTFCRSYRGSIRKTCSLSAALVFNEYKVPNHRVSLHGINPRHSSRNRKPVADYHSTTYGISRHALTPTA